LWFDERAKVVHDLRAANCMFIAIFRANAKSAARKSQLHIFREERDIHLKRRFERGIADRLSFDKDWRKAVQFDSF
jgi:hypothetical protein